MSNFKQRWLNAKAVSEQLKNDEWEFTYNRFTRGCCRAERKGLKLWVGNGPFGCEIDKEGANCFGLLFRHYVWWSAVRRKTKEANKTHKVNIIVEDITA